MLQREPLRAFVRAAQLCFSTSSQHCLRSLHPLSTLGTNFICPLLLLRLRRSRLLHAPQQGSRFPDFPPSPVHHHSSRPDHDNSTESEIALTTAMANLFRRIYDWLLRLFWYAYLSFSYHVKCHRSDACLMRYLILCQLLSLRPRKSKITGDDNMAWLMTADTVQGD